jgi:hypothetical protein
MSRNRTARLLVELLEDRTLMSAAGLVAIDDGPLPTFKNSPITVDVLANDLNPNGGTLSVVSLNPASHIQELAHHRRRIGE